jgi:UDP-glucuronate decarboxylase
VNRIVLEDLQSIAEHALPWENIFGKTILVTGSNGFLGRHIVKVLEFFNTTRSADIDIICLSKSNGTTPKGVTSIVQDVCSPISINKWVDFVFHAASPAKPSLYSKRPVDTINANVLGTINLLNEFPDATMLYFSSGGVYGCMDKENIPISETCYGYVDPTDFKACYNESKRMAENICASYFYQFATPTIIVRPSYVYGPLMASNDERACSTFVHNAISRKPITLTSGASATRSFCYITDAITGFFSALFFGEYGQAYNIGAIEETSISDLAKVVSDCFPAGQVKISKSENRSTKNTVNRSCLSIEKIKKLGWIPKIGLKKGIERTISSYKKELSNGI